LSFGLSLGWAIEGICGSSFKIEISYFSPFINQAKILESYNKNYDTSIIISDSFYDMMSETGKLNLRQIDLIQMDNLESKNIINLII
jgi:hypothetical protein